MKKILILIAFIGQGLFGQGLNQENLFSKPYDTLISLYDQNVSDSLIAKQIAIVYIDKARMDGDSIKMARGYSRLSFVATYKDALKYLDTTIILSCFYDCLNYT